jgi:hypothetical protein
MVETKRSARFEHGGVVYQTAPVRPAEPRRESDRRWLAARLADARRSARFEHGGVVYQTAPVTY